MSLLVHCLPLFVERLQLLVHLTKLPPFPTTGPIHTHKGNVVKYTVDIKLSTSRDQQYT